MLRVILRNSYCVTICLMSVRQFERMVIKKDLVQIRSIAFAKRVDYLVLYKVILFNARNTFKTSRSVPQASKWTVVTIFYESMHVYMYTCPVLIFITHMIASWKIIYCKKLLQELSEILLCFINKKIAISYRCHSFNHLFGVI